MSMRKTIAAALFALVLPAGAATHDMVRAEVRKVDRDAGKVTLRHERIPNLDMAAMTMVFRVRNPALLDQLKAGDRIRFAAEKIDGAITIVKAEPAPPTKP
jgi:Cu/Ag efflux protein CusF